MSSISNLNVGDIPYSNNIDVATNELFLRSTINRNTEKLLSNDIYLYDFVLKFKESGDYTVLPWKEKTTYKKGDVVIYTEYDKDREKILNLYMLQCVVDDNVEEPKRKTTDKYIADFSDSGWNNLNPFLELFYSDSPTNSLSNFIEDSISNKFELSHENDLEYHRFGNLAEHSISNVVLKNDVSNIADERDCGYWPYIVEEISSKAYDGIMRKWGAGIVELDLTCKLLGSKEITKIDEDTGEVSTTDYLAANNFIPISSEANDAYFMNRAAYSIFSKTGDNKIIEVNDVYQTNLISTMNVYHGKIEFPIQFTNTEYMIFASAIRNGDEVESPSTLTFVDRTKKSIEMVYAIPNYRGLSMREAALTNNKFQLQIIGKWR